MIYWSVAVANRNTRIRVINHLQTQSIDSGQRSHWSIFQQSNKSHGPSKSIIIILLFSLFIVTIINKIHNISFQKLSKKITNFGILPNKNWNFSQIKSHKFHQNENVKVKNDKEYKNDYFDCKQS